MKVGIMTMHRIPNLGSFLQAYGLKSMIETMGHDVQFIDIPRGEIVDSYGHGSDKKRINVIYDKLNKIIHSSNIIQFKNRHFSYFNKEYLMYLEKYLGITSKENIAECDTLVVGSDEVFNCLNPEYGFSLAPFGEYTKAKKIISYAASCGWTKLDFLNDSQRDRLKKALVKMQAISVRDENTLNFVGGLGFEGTQMHLDPVLVADFSKLFVEAENQICKKPYILIYAYYNRISDSKTIREIKRIAKEKGCKLIALGAPQYWCDDYITVDPKYVLSVFDNAKYVVTDTFHGTVLSIRSHSNFVTILRKSNRNKLYYLLKRLGLEERIANDSMELEGILKSDIDFSAAEMTLQMERERTLEYLKSNI